ncbi:odorant receptor 67a-like [Zophobas morio]|uniref:odorant receptor 67a-like n=1 Tax=Zophobas morio TaxID=2755281 RepID=UPI00308377D8
MYVTSPNKDPTYYSLKLLRVCGLHPDSRSKLLYVYFCVNYSCFMVILTLAITGVATTYDTNIFEAIENLQTVFLYIHLLGKYPNMFFKKHKLAYLLQQRSKFWSVEKFSGDIRKECDAILTTTTKFVRYFIVITFLVIMNFFLQPILTGDLPVRFKLLAHKFENLTIENKAGFEKEVKKIVDHQNFLMEYCQEINHYTNAIFLNQVIVSTAIICMQLFIVSQKEFLLPNKLKCLGYCLMEIVETVIYCFNAELLSEASENVGNAAYNSKWYDTNVSELRKSIVLVISRSQKRIVFSGFGLVLINLKTFTQDLTH